MRLLQDFGSELLVALLFSLGGWLFSRWQGRLAIGRNMKINPDRTKIVSEIRGDLYVTDSTGTTTNLTHSFNREADALWANRQDWLAFQREEKDGWGVWVVGIDSGRMVKFVSFPTPRPYGWDNDDNLIIHLGGSDWTIKEVEIARKLNVH